MNDTAGRFLPDGSGSPGRGAISTYIVTGCAGFIGSHLSEALLQRGDAVIGIDAFTDYYPRAYKQANLEHLLSRPGFVFLDGDLIDAPLDGLFQGVDGVFHLAAQPGVRGSWGSTFQVYLRENLQATERVFSACVRAGVRVVFASSSSVYGNSPAYPTTENTDCTRVALRRHEAVLRAAGARVCDQQGPQGDRAALLHGLRPTPAARHGHTAHRYRCRGQRALHRVRQRRSVPRRDLRRGRCDRDDRRHGHGAGGNRYNVGGGSETSLRRLIEVAQERDTEIDVDFGSPALGDVQRTAADTSLIDADTGWSARTSLEEGLVSQLAWTMSQLAWRREPAYAA